jgi:hypothetical protein
VIKTLADLPTPAERVQRVEFVRRAMWKSCIEEGALPAIEDLPLSEASTTWLVRMRQALCDGSVSQESFRELQRAFGGYLQTLSPEDAGELNRRVREFDQVKHLIIEATR